MITALLIDDDVNLRLGMRGMLQRYAPDFHVVGEAESVASGMDALELVQPQVLFLDIQMADGSGFDLLEKMADRFGQIATQVVFITAHQEYAIKAFRFSALDFLLKPVDPTDLQEVIEKIRLSVQKNNGFAHLDLLLENIRKKVDNFKRIALSTAEGIHLIEIKDIIRCESQDNYTQFFLRNAKPILISKTLKEYE
jgi:two-component system LytT family response regulator